MEKERAQERAAAKVEKASSYAEGAEAQDTRRGCAARRSGLHPPLLATCVKEEDTQQRFVPHMEVGNMYRPTRDRKAQARGAYRT